MLQPYFFIGDISAFWDGVLLHWNIRDKRQLRYQNINRCKCKRKCKSKWVRPTTQLTAT
eukprot:COSAG05_NODE_1422_length_4926_cov_14.914647_5_plen_59_part_00